MEQKFSIVGCEKKTVDDLQKITNLFQDFNCVSISTGFDESLDHLLRKTPSLVFIDLDRKGKMKDPFCFVNVLNHYLEELPIFIGISKSKKLAYEAIKNNFFDLLLAPLSEFEMRKCLMRYEKKFRERNSEKLCLKSYSDYRFINFNEILYVKADNNTTDFYLTEGRKVSAYKTLKHFEKSLPGEFLRIHHSYIINTRQVNRINYGKSVIALHGQAPDIPFSKSYKLQVDDLRENLITSLSIVS